MLKEAAESLNNDLLLAASGEPEPKLNDDGWSDVVAIPKINAIQKSLWRILTLSRTRALKPT